MIKCKTRRDAALAILERGERLTRKGGSFLGQVVVDPRPLTPKQAEWFHQLAERAGVAVEGVPDNG